MQLLTDKSASREHSCLSGERIVDVSFFERFKPRRIGRQIGYGYFLAIAIGWAGSLTGLVVADHLQGQGVLQLEDAQTQASLLSNFEHAADQAQLHGERSVYLADTPQKLQENLVGMRLNLTETARLLQEFDQFLNDQPAWVADAPETLRSLLEGYNHQLNQQATKILAAIETDNPQATLKTILTSPTTAQLDQHCQALAVLIQIAQMQEITATDAMEKAQGFEKLLIMTSMAIAVVIAGLAAWRTTRAIAAPIENITQVARQVANKADYQLRATVLSNDEIGLLAHSLNHLIEWVAEHTQSLEQIAQTAEAQNQELETTLKTLRRAQLQLVQAEKMSSLGQLVAGIAHEINNPIGVIHGNIIYAQEYSETLFSTLDHFENELTEMSDDLVSQLSIADVAFIREDFPKVLQSLRNGADRISSLVLSLKVFARLQESQLKHANLNEGIDSTLLLLGHRLKRQAKRPEIRVIRRYSSSSMVECYSSQINQVFMNILTNAVDAINERWHQIASGWQPRIVISTKMIGDHMHVLIQNNGSAIPEAIQSKIFDPFFTTKSVGQGIGLGISISYEIITKQHHGTLSFISPIEDDIGALFTLTIPRKQTQKATWPQNRLEPISRSERSTTELLSAAATTEQSEG